MIERFFTKRLIIFGLIGALNTLIDISLFYALFTAGLPILVANIASTSVALCVSLLLNNKFTFAAGSHNKQKTISFIGVTLVGLWLLQPAVIWLVLSVQNNPLIAKIIALPATVIWNYLWYHSVVFKKKGS